MSFRVEDSIGMEITVATGQSKLNRSVVSIAGFPRPLANFGGFWRIFFVLCEFSVAKFGVFDLFCEGFVKLTVVSESHFN